MAKLNQDDLMKIRHADTMIQIARDLLAGVTEIEDIRETMKTVVSATIAVHRVRLRAENGML